ncbi:hypothetical protein EVAR_72117_1 [Eumeta japonica]|uniref:Uncharacterized protein n=1 Tax=Eumeta variegata TaxID=151549 RepID=A0A4C1SZ94_EUMVA|nr:hypothetical protein EVAR_72117_1 [Eumeta japonica]
MWTSCERSSSRPIETTINGNGTSEAIGRGVIIVGPGSSQHETLADIEHISTIAGSLVSIGSISHTQPRYGTNDAGYDTEHTSLNSDFDEAELRRELLRDYFTTAGSSRFKSKMSSEIGFHHLGFFSKRKIFLKKIPKGHRNIEKKKAPEINKQIVTITLKNYVLYCKKVEEIIKK